MRSTIYRGKFKLLALLIVMLLTACGNAALYDQIGEADANEMLSVLGKAGIAAEKSQRSADGWRIVVASSDVSLALEVLNSGGLPRERFRNIGELFPKEGLVSTPVEEHMRTIYAVSQELSRTISGIDGVITARVHLNMPRKESLLQAPQIATASVFVKYRAEVNMQQNVLAIKELVIGAVKGLDHSNVMVALFPWSPQSATTTSTEYTQVLGVAVSPRSYGRLVWLVYLPWVLLSLVFAVALFVVWHMLESNFLGDGVGGRLKHWWRQLRRRNV
ncbi:type III secretion inner membrane ring lipoprotein SctJ [Collimonas sp. H4R21]|uniref:Lipoprotein n=1 Tax=Collimonas rhizosphaerae TaxID=3126357 RepID=A0ABU9PYM0_9BURK